MILVGTTHHRRMFCALADAGVAADKDDEDAIIPWKIMQLGDTNILERQVYGIQRQASRYHEGVWVVWNRYCTPGNENWHILWCNYLPTYPTTSHLTSRNIQYLRIVLVLTCFHKGYLWLDFSSIELFYFSRKVLSRYNQIAMGSVRWRKRKIMAV